MDGLKTQMVGFERKPAPQARKSARKPKPRKSGPDKKLEEQLPKKKRGDRSHMALIESVMAEARGPGGRGGGKQGGSVPTEELPRQTKAGVKRPMDVLADVFGGASDTLMGSEGRQGSRQSRQIPHTESTAKYVGFMADLTTDTVLDAFDRRPPRPTDG